ncbi:hypothetical protein HZH66_012689 [Vespula vulgaris]|uniref:Uncharacterized protein n=1 Tax=Vespula vulgaris TaxID=7454 RepID=A0A834MUS0_VESVU|nr:hypothetical protein HZH66_012689 [Vespula vulgaris]
MALVRTTESALNKSVHGNETSAFKYMTYSLLTFTGRRPTRISDYPVYGFLVRECSIAIVRARSKEEAICRRGPHNIVAQEGNYRRRVIFSEDHFQEFHEIEQYSVELESVFIVASFFVCRNQEDVRRLKDQCLLPITKNFTNYDIECPYQYILVYTSLRYRQDGFRVVLDISVFFPALESGTVLVL